VPVVGKVGIAHNMRRSLAMASVGLNDKSRRGALQIAGRTLG
jgi:hypothetical protein